jgi:hypothetical protein
MKKFLFLLFVGTLLLTAAPPGPSTVTLAWTYPSNELSGITFYLQSSPNQGTPTTNWPVIASVTGTNRIQITVMPGQAFYTVYASNFWGASSNSNIANTPPWPRNDEVLTVDRP